MRRRRISGLAPFVLLALCAPAGIPAQQPSLDDRLRAEVARVWSMDPSKVRVELTGAAPDRVDSVDVARGATGRWIVTLWVGDRALRRFARAGLVRTMPVAARPLTRGRTVEADDVVLEERVRWDAPSTALPDPTGMVAERRIQPGEPLLAPAVRPPLMVRGGDEVEAVLRQDGVVMRVRAEALASARRGEALAVRLASGVRRDGRATAPGVVELIDGGGR